MISYSSLILSSFGIIWISYIFSKLLIKKKTKQESVIKKMLSSLIPLHAKKHSTDSLEYSFMQALKTLNTFLPEKNNLYQLPWFMAIGDNQSGKNTFFNSVKLDEYLDIDDLHSKNGLCDWHFFNNGVFLNLSGDLIKKSSATSNQSILNEKKWFQTLRLLNKARYEKPLDGVMIFISINDLLDNIDNAATIIQNAEYMYTKLWQMQQELHLRLPIYIIFTHLDALEGFKEFLHSVPEECLQNMFGWSNPYSLDAAFQEYWVDEMFSKLEEDFEHLQAEFFLHQTAEICRNTLLFFRNFIKLKSSIRNYLERIFQINKYAESFFLRGIYFVGVDNSARFYEKTYNWPKVGNDTLSNFNLNQDDNKIQQFFVTDILNKKIFLEKNLAKHTGGVNYNEKNKLKNLNISLACFSVISCIYLINVHDKLSNIKTSVNPRIVRINQIVKERKANMLSKNAEIEDEMFLNEARALLQAIVNISNVNMMFVFVPTSWISNLKNNLLYLLIKANDVILVKAIALKIEEKYRQLADCFITEDLLQSSRLNLSTPLEHPSFIKLNQFVNETYDLEKIEQKFISATENGNLDSLSWLIKKLFFIEMPKDFYSKSTIFAQGLKKNIFTNIHFKDYKEQIKNHLQALFQNFVKSAFILDNFIDRFVELNNILQDLEKDNCEFSVSSLIALQSAVSSLISFANSPKFSWIHSNTLNIPIFNELYDKIQYSFNEETAISFRKLVNAKFSELKEEMRSLKVPVIGNLFYLDVMNFVRVSDGLIQLQGMLNKIFSEPFMRYFQVKKLSDINYGASLVWNIAALTDIANILHSYEDFLNKKLSTYPIHMQKMLKNIAKSNMIDLIETKLVDAHSKINNEQSNSAIVHISENIRLGYDNIVLILDKLLNLDERLFHEMEKIEKQRSTNVLMQVNTMLDIDRLYEIDQGEINPKHLLFDMPYFPLNITDYLSVQKNKITYYAKEIMEPVMKLIAFLKVFDNSIMDSIARKWVDLIKSVNEYSILPASSSLFQLENFIKQMDLLKIDMLANLAREYELLTTSDNYFLQKLINIKRKLYENTNKLIKRIVDDHYVKAVIFYQAYSRFFPFNIGGQIIPLTAYNELINLMKLQFEQLEMIRRIQPNIKHKNIKFVQGLERMLRIIQFLIQPGAVINMEIKSPDSTSETYEQNLEYLVSASVSIGPTTVFFPDSGSLKVVDRIIFKFKLANQSKMSFAFHDKRYQISSYEATLILDKKEFVTLMLTNLVTKNGRTFFRFEIPIIDPQGKKTIIIYTLPVELSIDGVMIYLPDDPLSVSIDEKVIQ